MTQPQSIPSSTSLNKKAVLVTGCSSGIGRATAIYLAEQSFTVFATVRKQTDADELTALKLPTLVPVCPLDLTKSDDIANAVTTIRAELKSRQINGLYAIVNNAGAGGIAPIELMDVNKFRTELDARVLAPIQLLQGLLPAIREAHGRILWIATPSIIPIAFVSNIHVCDFAVNGLARTLQIELKHWNIPNVLIRCGGVKTASVAKSAQELEADFQTWPHDRFELYAEVLKKEQEGLTAFDEKRSEPREIAQVIFQALTAPKPKRRYQVGYLSGLGAMLEYLPQTWVDAIMMRRA